MLHEVVSDALEQSALPQRGVLDVRCVELLLYALEGAVQLLIIQLVVVLVPHSEHGCDQRLLVLVQQHAEASARKATMLLLEHETGTLVLTPDHVLELDGKPGAYRVLSYASEALPSDAVADDQVVNPEALAATMTRALERAGTRTRRAAAWPCTRP